ncbi:MAG: hypothetical protein IT384_14070 [Deltaproteobacteria bacterium]|nr:hypothetical protein [Deltaproteobacteria bacterium]
MWRLAAISLLMTCFIAACGDETSDGGDGPPSDASSDGGTEDGSVSDAHDAADQSDADGAIDAGEPSADASVCAQRPGSRTVRGTSIATYHTRSATEARGRDFVVRPIRAYSRGTGDCYIEYPVVATATGAFVVHDLPPGPYFVAWSEDFWVEAEADPLDLGYELLGRPDTVEASPGTTLELHVQNLGPWTAWDNLELYCLEASAFMLDIRGVASAGVPQPGAQALTGLTVDYDWFTADAPNLIDSALGDRPVLAQLAARTTTAGETYSSLSRVFEPASFTMADGQRNVLSGSFVELAQTASITIHWRRAEFAALVPEVTPTVAFVNHVLAVEAVPRWSRSLDVPAADLVSFVSGDARSVRTRLEYGVHRPNEMTKDVTAIALVAYDLALPGATPAASFVSVSSEWLEPADGQDAAPLISPPTLIRVAGADARTQIMGVGPTPVISWAPPRLGAVRDYSVAIHEIYVEQGRTRAQRVFTAQALRGTFLVPAGLLERGKFYRARITAFHDLEKGADQPFRVGAVIGSAAVDTAVFSP